VVWLIIGLIYYYFYGHKHSQLSNAGIRAAAAAAEEKKK
jgi:hypothetical protein